MPAMMTAAAVVTCIHGGTVIIQPSQTIVTIQGMPVLTVPPWMHVTTAAAVIIAGT